MPPTLDVVVQHLAEIEKQFFQNESLRVDYERVSTRDLIPRSPSNGLLLAEWVLAYRNNKWFFERRFTKPMKTQALEVPGQPTTIVVKDGVLLEWLQHANSASVASFGLGVNSYSGLYYTRALSLDAPKYIAGSGGADLGAVRKKYPDEAGLPFLPDYIRDNRDHYRVLPTQENINGALCWVVEWPGMDRICVDPARGFAIVSRSYNWGPGKPARFRFDNSSFREVLPGLWLPFAVSETKFASIRADAPALWGKGAALSEYKVKSMEFNQIPDSLFDVRLPPDTRVIDSVRNIRYTTPANPNADALSDALAEAILQSKSRSAWVMWIVVGAGVILALFAVLYWRGRRTRSTV